MDIGKRLRELRQAKGWSHRDLATRTGFAQCYISRVENGRQTPTLRILEKWATALELKLAQLFTVGDEKPEAPQLPERNPLGPQEQTLLRLFSKILPEDRPLLITLAREMVKRAGQRE